MINSENAAFILVEPTNSLDKNTYEGKFIKIPKVHQQPYTTTDYLLKQFWKPDRTAIPNVTPTSSNDSKNLSAEW